jgi:pimeloyl-ACP methyl ester carboxylesterase
VELYGFGRSVTKDTPKTWRGRTIDQCFQLMCTALEQWRIEMSIDSFVLLGHSLGCHVVSAYAMGYPQRVQHLMLASPIGVGVSRRNNQAVSRANSAEADGSDGDGGGSGSGGGWMQYVGDVLWDFGFTPQDLLRWTGPVGV